MPEQPPIQLPGEDKWRLADAIEWLRRHGIEGVHYREEGEYHAFFENFEVHWDHEDYLEERPLENVDGFLPAGVRIVYRRYTTYLKAAYAREARSIAGGERWVRVFLFFHDHKNYGRNKPGTVPYSQRRKS